MRGNTKFSYIHSYVVRCYVRTSKCNLSQANSFHHTIHPVKNPIKYLIKFISFTREIFSRIMAIMNTHILLLTMHEIATIGN